MCQKRQRELKSREEEQKQKINQTKATDSVQI